MTPRYSRFLFAKEESNFLPVGSCWGEEGGVRGEDGVGTISRPFRTLLRRLPSTPAKASPILDFGQNKTEESTQKTVC